MAKKKTAVRKAASKTTSTKKVSARKANSTNAHSSALQVDSSVAATVQKQAPPAEERFAVELEFLAAIDSGPKPAGWKLSPASVVLFVCGSEGENLKLPSGVKVSSDVPKSMVISEKFVGERALVERCVVTLAGERGLLLVGEPGTAKSMISELLAAAISGTSSLTIQGTAGTNEDHFRYSWNYSLLLAQGPTQDALVPSPIMLGMQQGQVVRVEEVTRCLPEVQDALISLLSERRLMIPEIHDESGSVFASPGFNIIATANLRDKGVSEMSAALKRRFNFETVGPIAEHDREVQLVRSQASRLLEQTNVEFNLDEGILDILVTAFRDLREGQTVEGWSVEKPGTVMSTAEAVAIATSIGRQSEYFPSQRDPISLVPGHLLGAVLKDDAQDRGRLLAYWDSVVKRRADDGSRIWKRMLELRAELE